MLLAMESPWYISESEILIRLVIALVLGGIVGFEREQHRHAAGFRTNILVCVGACLMMLLSIYGFSDFVNEWNVRVDPARLAAAVITGVGFLGAGTILFTGKKISGLTTAASLWVVAAVGLAVGAGFYFASIAVTVMVILTLWLFNKLEQRFIRNKKQYIIHIKCTDQAALLSDVQQKLKAHSIALHKLSVGDLEEAGTTASNDELAKKRVEITLHVDIERKSDEAIVSFVHDLKQVEGIHWIQYE
ncbi:methyltransferase [Paenibacillus montaniterrae]|uniref:Methyltransferase n=2 Tax=Paenibacillus montaniterrae TaxID=429341 RepID=A0A920CWU7_9BACL|nr:methyltransferase [Paenibacillus montaniterrae]